jgi:flagellar motility protein MotE (MotC chaperone)
MAPRDAAKVMVQLDDVDVQAIVGALTEKQAAAILANFPPERAAKISKGTMRSSGRAP